MFHFFISFQTAVRLMPNRRAASALFQPQSRSRAASLSAVTALGLPARMILKQLNGWGLFQNPIRSVESYFPEKSTVNLHDWKDPGRGEVSGSPILMILSTGVHPKWY